MLNLTTSTQVFFLLRYEQMPYEGFPKRIVQRDLQFTSVSGTA